MIGLLLSAAIIASAASDQLVEAVRTAGDLYRQGKQEEASKAVAQALVLLAGRTQQPDFDVASSLNNLGALLYAQGDSDRAEQLFLRSRDAYVLLAGPGDTRLATILYNLAGIYVEKGRYTDAEPLYREAMAIRERTFGPSHPIVAEVWNALGFLLLQQKKLGEAEIWLQKAANVWQTAAGSEAFAAVALNNLAYVRRLQGNAGQAESLYKQAIAAEEANFGDDHPEIATTLMNLAALHRSRGDSAQATATYRRALDILARTVGAQDPLAIEIRSRLAEWGEYQILVVKTREEALQLRRRIAAGEDFARLATAHSIDPNGPNGGSFRALPTDLRAELRARLDPLPSGQTSDPFPLDRNWAIVRKVSDASRPDK